jgi:prevent-host-death family protein
MTRILPISEVKTHLPELVDTLEARHDHVVVTRKGKPAAILLSYEEYERLRETLDVLSDPGLMRQVHQSLDYFAKGGAGQTYETVFGEPLLPTIRTRRRAS